MLDMSAPNIERWSARKTDGVIIDGQHRATEIVSCGDLKISSGKLSICDPIEIEPGQDYDFIAVPNGRFPVFVTFVDLSEKCDLSKFVSAYASIVFAEGNEIFREWLPRPSQNVNLEIGFKSQFNIFVDTAGACFFDPCSLENCMPQEDWDEICFGKPGGWSSQLYDPSHIRFGMANIVFPLAQNGENIVFIPTRLDDGKYPVVGGYDSNRRLMSVNVDCLVV
jgi:hypothetical protein